MALDDFEPDVRGLSAQRLIAASDPTAAGAMRGLSALRLLARHFVGIPEITLTVDVGDWRDTPGLRIILHQQTGGGGVRRLAEALGLPEPTTTRERGSWQVSAQGEWNGYEIRVATVITDEAASAARAEESAL